MNELVPATWSLPAAAAVFGISTLFIAAFGTLITRVVDQLADRTGLGEAVSGAVLLGASTSLSGSVLSVTAAWDGHIDLSLSNAIGGIAVQTVFLVVADIAYRRANLEHAAASPANMMQNGLLIVLLSLILIAQLLPDYTLLGIHPVTPVLFAVYAYGISLVRNVRTRPMWKAIDTAETRTDQPESPDSLPPLASLWVQFLALMLVLGLSGWMLERAAATLAERTWLEQSVIGALMTAVCTSLPELVTSVAAVRRGALTLAVAGIIGGNAFDTLFVAASDIAYREGSIYHGMSGDIRFWIVLSIVMAAVLIMGLIRRELRGPGRIGFESAAILVLYGIGVVKLLAFE